MTCSNSVPLLLILYRICTDIYKHMALSKDQGSVSRTPKAWSTNRGFMVVKPGLPGDTIRTKRLVNQSIPGKLSHSNNKKNQAVEILNEQGLPSLNHVYKKPAKPWYS